jgi:uncharacterized protein (TIGR03435 family)
MILEHGQVAANRYTLEAVNRRLFMLLLWAGGIALAQSFDVASVKLLPDNRGILTGSVKRQGGTLYMRGLTLGWAIRWAYDLQQYELAGPDWIQWRADNQMPRYDIEGKSGTATTAAEVRPMLQGLLAERFGLKSHYEDRPMDVLVVKAGAITSFVDGGEPTFTLKGTVLEIRSATMRELCDDLSLGLHIPLIDETGFGEKRFDASVRILAEGKSLDEWISATVAGLHKDLGVTVSKAKMPIKVMVVDAINKTPTSN